MSAGTVQHDAAYRALVEAIESSNLGRDQMVAVLVILASVEASSAVLADVDQAEADGDSDRDYPHRCGVAEGGVTGYRDALLTLGAPHVVDLELHDGGRRRVQVDLDRLTPRARALAEIVAATPLQTRSWLTLESTRTVRELGPSAEEARTWWTAAQLDEPHQVTWEHWARYPANSTVDPHEYLEAEVRKMPMGYYPVGGGLGRRVPSAAAARDDADLINRAQVLDLMRAMGRPIGVASLYNYRRIPPAGWPGIVKYVGRTPQWSRQAIEVYASARRA